MNEKTLEAFLEELAVMEKDAFVGKALTAVGKRLAAAPGAVGRWLKAQPAQFVEAGRRIRHPVQSLKTGLREMNPAKQLAHLKSTGASPEQIARYTSGMGKHITQGLTPGAGRIQNIAERMSRAGWSGKGQYSKYVPLWSQKGMYTGFGALGAKSTYDAAKRRATPTGEGGVAETGLGELLGNAALIAGSGGLGLLPATAMWLGANTLGSRAGRVVDRLRGGANLETAVRAPSPQEAQSMLEGLENQSPEEQQKTIETLQRYYG